MVSRRATFYSVSVVDLQNLCSFANTPTPKDKPATDNIVLFQILEIWASLLPTAAVAAAPTMHCTAMRLARSLIDETVSRTMTTQVYCMRMKITTDINLSSIRRGNSVRDGSLILLSHSMGPRGRPPSTTLGMGLLDPQHRNLSQFYFVSAGEQY